MNTQLLMTASALVMGVCGVLLEFLPREILHYAGIDAAGSLPVFVQLLGALYLGFAMMNWMAKSVLIGGVYARPLAMGNFLHFAVGALTLLKYASVPQRSLDVWIASLLYSLFAVLFGIVVFTHPLKRGRREADSQLAGGKDAGAK